MEQDIEDQKNYRCFGTEYPGHFLKWFKTKYYQKEITDQWINQCFDESQKKTNAIVLANGKHLIPFDKTYAIIDWQTGERTDHDRYRKKRGNRRKPNTNTSRNTQA